MGTDGRTNSQNNLPIWVWVLLAIPVFLCPFLNRSKEFSNALNGQPAPVLSFLGLDGSSHKLSDYRDKVVLLNFWASWCGPCMSEMEGLKSLHEQVGPKGFAVLAVNIEEDAKHIASLPAETRATLPPLLFHSPVANEVAFYRVNALPLSFLIGKDGKVIKTYYGAYHWDPPNFANEFQHFLN